MKKWLAIALGWVVAAGVHAAEPSRVVSLGGSVTEIVYGLGEGDRLVGDDLSSLYPEAATKLPRVGYYRAVPVEGVLSLKPDLVLASEQAGRRTRSSGWPAWACAWSPYRMRRRWIH